MKKIVLFIVTFITLSNITKANPSDPSHHSSLRPQYKGYFSSKNKNIGAFTQVLRNAVNGTDVSYFQDPYITERLAAHFEAVLGNNYPGNPIEVVNNLHWISAEDFTGTLQMGMLTLDYKSTDWDPNWKPRPGEMIGLYGDIPLISSYCGNLVKGIYVASQQQPPQTAPQQQPTTTPTATAGNIQVNVNTGQSVSEFYSAYRLGQSDMAGIEDHDMLKMAEMKQILGSGSCGSSNTTTTTTVGQPMYVVSQQPAEYSQNVNVRVKPNATDVLNTIFNGVNALDNSVNTFRGIKMAIPRQQYYQTGYVLNNGGGNPWQRGNNMTPLNPYGPVVVSNTGERNTSSLNGVIPVNQGGGYGNGTGSYTSSYNLQSLGGGGY